MLRMATTRRRDFKGFYSFVDGTGGSPSSRSTALRPSPDHRAVDVGLELHGDPDVAGGGSSAIDAEAFAFGIRRLAPNNAGTGPTALFLQTVPLIRVMGLTMRAVARERRRPSTGPLLKGPILVLMEDHPERVQTARRRWVMASWAILLLGSCCSIVGGWQWGSTADSDARQVFGERAAAIARAIDLA